MEAARVAALRGHKVILYEKEERLGGQLLLAAVPPGRGEFLSFVHYLERQLEKNGVTVHLKTEVSLLQVEREKPDVIVLATGGFGRTYSRSTNSLLAVIRLSFTWLGSLVF